MEIFYPLKAMPPKTNGVAALAYIAALLALPFSCLSKAENQLEPNLLQPFSAQYKIFRSGKEVGYAQRSLKQLEKQQYQLNSRTFVELFIFEDDRDEQVTFTVENNQVSPLFYQFKHSGVASEKDNQLTFDYQQQTIHQRKNKPVKAKWQAWLDQLSYQQQIKIDVVADKTDVTYSVIDRKAKQRSYRFSVVGEETLTLPIGEVNTIKLKRVRENSSRETFLWLSMEHNYALARLVQYKQGKEQADLRLNEFVLQ